MTPKLRRSRIDSRVSYDTIGFRCSVCNRLRLLTGMYAMTVQRLGVNVHDLWQDIPEIVLTRRNGRLG